MSARLNAVAARDLSGRLAFSYLRVSTGKQAVDGRAGIDRQADAFLPFCERHRLTPNPDPLIDQGLSAFHGRHRSKGALAAFVEAAALGHVPPGSVLVVEDLDRFSREAPSHAEQLLHKLWDQDLALGIVRDDVVIDRQHYDADLGVRVMLLARRDAAHDQSRKLSYRITDVWERRRVEAAAGRKYPAARPFWCDWDEEAGDFKLNDQALIPRLAVQLSIEGMGFTQIAQHFNAEGYRNTSGKPYTYAWVRRIIADRRMLGEQQWKGDTQPLQGYFPAVITEADWAACWAAIDSRNRRKGKVGRGTHIRNLFQGLTFCPCGSPLTYLPARDREGRPRSYAYLRCTGKQNNTCTEGRSNPHYDEEWMLRSFMTQRWDQFFRRPSDSKERRALQAKILKAETDHRKQQAAADAAAGNMAELLASGSLDTDTATMISKAASTAKGKAAALGQELSKLRSELQLLDQRPTGKQQQEQLRERVEAFIASDCEDVAERRKFNNWLSTLGVKITISEAAAGSRWAMAISPMEPPQTAADGSVSVAGAEIHVSATR